MAARRRRAISLSTEQRAGHTSPNSLTYWLGDCFALRCRRRFLMILGQQRIAAFSKITLKF